MHITTFAEFQVRTKREIVEVFRSIVTMCFSQKALYFHVSTSYFNVAEIYSKKLHHFLVEGSKQKCWMAVKTLMLTFYNNYENVVIFIFVLKLKIIVILL
jgi:hypothetical protein